MPLCVLPQLITGHVGSVVIRDIDAEKILIRIKESCRAHAFVSITYRKLAHPREVNSKSGRLLPDYWDQEVSCESLECEIRDGGIRCDVGPQCECLWLKIHQMIGNGLFRCRCILPLPEIVHERNLAKPRNDCLSRHG